MSSLFYRRHGFWHHFRFVFSQASIGPQVTVENIRRVKIGMPRSEVERLLGMPFSVEHQDQKVYGPVLSAGSRRRKRSNASRFSTWLLRAQ
jgi:hypothetical protein